MAFEFKDHLTAPPATTALFLFSRDGHEISRHENLCQICARELLIWHVWTIWENGRTITYEQSMAVGVPIPSLATLFSITYKPPKSHFGSNWFQFQPANTCLAQRSVRLLITRSPSVIQGSAPFLSLADYYSSPFQHHGPALYYGMRNKRNKSLAEVEH